VERDLGWSLDALVADTRANVNHLAEDLADLRQDVRRIDDRLFQLMLVTLGTLATTIASLVANVVA
jgi:ABC-type transporter Mla subunit MlaD